ncbi:MAG: tetratricopeptide repeat protein [Chitinophagales bacterium]|nr:tetratricopeptide repeat protein [Chitinophagales bacterium]
MGANRIDQLNNFLEQNPNDSFVLYALATEYVNMGDDETALSFYQKILSGNPNYTGTYYHLGKLYQRRNEKQKAEETFNDGL